MFRYKKIFLAFLLVFVVASSMSVFAGGEGDSGGGGSSVEEAAAAAEQYAEDIRSGRNPEATDKELENAANAACANGKYEAASVIESYLGYKNSSGSAFNWDDCLACIEACIDAVNDFFNDMKEAMKTGQFGTFLSNAVNGVKAFAGSVGAALQGAMDALGNLVSSGAKSIGAAVTDVVNAMVSAVVSNVVDEFTTQRENATTAAAKQKDGAAQKKGDPVRITNGEYVQHEIDLDGGGRIPFTIERFYGTENVMAGSVGKSWVSNLDMRLMFGVDAFPWKVETLAKETAEGIWAIRLELIEMMKDAYKVSGLESAESELKNNLAYWQSLFGEAKKNLNNAEAYSYMGGDYYSDLSDKSREAISLAQKAFDLVESQINNYKSILNSFPSDMEMFQWLSEKYNEAYDDWIYYKYRAELSDKLSAMNAPAMHENTPDSYYMTGLETIVFVDGQGVPHVFGGDEMEGTFWEPLYEFEKEYLYVKKITDSSINMFECAQKDGTKIYFDEHGLLVKITDRNENDVCTVKRNDAHKIVNIKTVGSEYNVTWRGKFISRIENVRDKTDCVLYEYKDDMLFSVTDSDSDVVLYDYNEHGLLSQLIKNDGSVMKFLYGKQDADGRFLTTETVNEEGFSEKFEYDYEHRVTVYTDHAGVVSKTFFDEHSRTVREELADGTVKEFVYDERGNCKSEVVNSHVSNYEYDDANNKIFAYYEDGSTERWLYDKHGFVTLHTDRDDVTEEFICDEKGNVTEYLLGGKKAQTIIYDERGLISRTINHGQRDYETKCFYDEFANLVRVEKANSIIEYEYDGRNRIVSYSVNGKVLETYGYTSKTVTVDSYNGMHKVYTYNGRKDLLSLEETDTVTGVSRIIEYEYDKRHLPVAMYYGDGEGGKYLAKENRYDAAGKLLATMLHPRDDGAAGVSSDAIPSIADSECWIMMYDYDDDSGVNTFGHTNVKQVDEIRKVSQFKIDLKKSHLLTDSRLDVRLKDIDLDELKRVAGNEVFETKYEKLIVADGVRISMTDSIGRKMSTEYDQWQRPAFTVGKDGIKNKINYSNGGRLLQKQAAHGGFYEYAYGFDGRIKNLGEEKTQPVSVTYFSDGKIASVTDRRGNVSAYSYDGEGRVSSVNSEGKIFWYEYDCLDRLVGVIVGASNDKQTAERFTEYKYSDDGRRLTVIKGGMYETVYETDAWGDIVGVIENDICTEKYVYDAERRVAEKIDAYGNVTRYSYNALGKIKRVDFPDKSKKNYVYDYMGNVVEISDDEGIYWIGKYDRAGRRIFDWGRAGTENEYVYDDADRIVKVIIGGEVAESYSYDERATNIAFTDGNGKDYFFEKDNFGRMIKETNREGGIQKFSYDAEGELNCLVDFAGNSMSIDYKRGLRQKDVRYDDGEKFVFLYDMNGSTTGATNETSSLRYEYDAGGKLIRQIDAESGEVTTYEYDKAGRRVLMVSGNREVFYEYGKNGELIFIIDNKQRLSVEFEYDNMMRETKRTFANGVSQVTSYDRTGRPIYIVERDAAGKLLFGEGYIYGTDGRRSATVSCNGDVTKYEYDVRGRLVAVYYPATDSVREHQRQEAEKYGVFYQEKSVGATNVYLLSSEYNNLVAILNKMNNSFGVRLSVTQNFFAEFFEYDANGNRISKTTPFGKIDYEYDAENRLVAIGANGRVAVKYGYDKNGNLLFEKSIYNEAEYHYNLQNRMTASRIVDETDGIALVARYGYDALGRRTIVQDKGASAMRTLYDGFSFDVIRESPTFASGTFSDAFDEGINYYSGNSDLDAGVGGGRYRYVGDWNEHVNGRLPKTQYKNVSARYTGERTMLYANSRAVAVSRGGSANYMGTDMLGSVRSVTNAYGSLESVRDYDVFGVPVTQAGGMASKGAVNGTLASAVAFSNGVEFGYTGKLYDAATGMYNYGYRDCAPSVARFTTSDPIRDGTNWFSYVANDPVNYVDLWGLEVIFSWPLEDNIITSHFGGRTDAVPNEHDGIDLRAKTGTSVYAMADGIVSLVDLSYEGSASGSSYLIVGSAEGYEQRYLHLDSFNVEVGDKVTRGMEIGKSGTRTNMPEHLHVEIRQNGIKLDPELILPALDTVPMSDDKKKNK